MANIAVVNSEIWMQPHPWLTLAELRKLIREEEITATPRLGARDAHHPKGYIVGQQAWLILKNERGEEERRRRVEVINLNMRQLMDFDPLSLTGCGAMYQKWGDVRRALGFFEQRIIHPTEAVTIVRFEYLDDEAA